MIFSVEYECSGIGHFCIRKYSTFTSPESSSRRNDADRSGTLTAAMLLVFYIAFGSAYAVIVVVVCLSLST